MSVVNVVADIDGDNYVLSENESGTYERSIAAPDSSTDVLISAEDESGNIATSTMSLDVINNWIPPKTDWIQTDYFNAVDYNRIIGNIAHLKQLADELYNVSGYSSLGSDKNYESMIYADEINLIETDLEVLNLSSYDFDIGSKTTYKANGSTPLYSEFNRIESAVLLLYNTLVAQKEALPRLAFTLGGQKGIKV